MGEPKIVVVDYHKGNLSSVARGLARAGAAACTSDDPEQIRNADGLVIPGVGAFYDAVAFMREGGEADAVLDAVAAGTPLLGICLGLCFNLRCGFLCFPEDTALFRFRFLLCFRFNRRRALSSFFFYLFNDFVACHDASTSLYSFTPLTMMKEIRRLNTAYVSTIAVKMMPLPVSSGRFAVR